MFCIEKLTAVLPLALVICSSAAQTATFDGLAEGNVTPVLVDGGITFFDADDRMTPPGPDNFFIENASAGGYGPLFSVPNVLTLTGYESGPQAGYSRMGEFKATFGGLVRSVAAVDVFYDNEDLGNSITLELLLSNTVVGSDVLVFTGVGFAAHHFEMSGIAFDTIRLYGSGPNNQGCFFGAVDNVQLDVPSSPAATVLLGGLLLRSRRSRTA